MIQEINNIMGKNKNKKSKASKKSKPKKVLEEQSDVEEVVQELETVNVEEDTESQVEDSSEKKPKKSSQKTFLVELEKLKNLTEKESELEKQIRELDEQKRKLNSQLKKLRREAKNIINGKLESYHKSEVKLASKEKRKRKKNVVSGFLKPQKVPDILVKYLGLEKGTELRRPQLMKLIHAKWTEDGLRQGQSIVLDKKAGKALGFPEGHVIEFSEPQTFVANFFKKESSNNVNV